LYSLIAARTVLGPAAGSGPPDSSGPVTTWIRDGTAATVVPANGLRVPADEFNRTQRQLVAELNAELAAIRLALADYVRTTDRPTDRKSINDLLKDFEDARQRQEIWDKYRDYQAATLQPGLSPDQRRLLFTAALEQLALPLPAGEGIP
jgi:hypothetical protein